MTLSYDETLLVTGFPSFRGRKMVEHLLAEQPKSLVYATVRDSLAVEAKAAIERLPPEQRVRLVPLDGDAAAMDLGLSGKEYRELASRVDRIHHVAQVNYPGVQRKMAETVNLGATREVMELGRVCSDLKSIVVHSSAVVSGNRTGTVREDELNAGQQFRSPVEETLARAERVARAAMSELPVSVIRPTQIVGDSRTGEVDRFDGPYLLMLLLITSPQEFPVLLPTKGDLAMNLVPIDYVVRAARHIGLAEGARGKTFHLADPEPLTVRRVFELVAESGGRRLPGGFIPTNLTRALLRAPGLAQLAKSPRAFVDSIATRVTYDTSNTDTLLANTDIRCPRFETYVDQLVAYVKQRVEERRRSERARRDDDVEDPLL